MSKQYTLKFPNLNQATKNESPVSIKPINIDYEYSDITFFIEQFNFYSGGRYYDFTVACALNRLGYKVLGYTNAMFPKMVEDFVFEKTPEFKISNMAGIDLPNTSSIFTANHSAFQAINIAARYNKPLYFFVYDPPQWLLDNEYIRKGSYDSAELHRSWAIKQQLQLLAHNIPEINIITLTENAIEPFKDYYDIPRAKFHYLTPAINFDICQSIKKSGIQKEPWIVTINRNDYRKNLSETIECYKSVMDMYELHIITNSPEGISDICQKNRIPEGKVFMHLQPTDIEKYEILAKSQMMICNSMFEGYGMWALEAAAMNLPLICYDLPSLKSLNLTNIIKVPLGDKELFTKTLNVVVRECGGIEAIQIEELSVDPSIQEMSKKLAKIVDVEVRKPIDRFCKTIPTTRNISRIRSRFNTEPVVFHFNSIYRNDVYEYKRMNHDTWSKVLSYKPDCHYQDVKDDISIITFNTSKESSILEEYCLDRGIDIYVDKDIKSSFFNFFIQKMYRSKELIEAGKTKYYLILDATDLIIAGDLRKFLAWEHKDTHVLFGAEELCSPESKTIERLQQLIITEETPFKYLNAGSIFGCKEKLLEMYDKAIETRPYQTTNPLTKDVDQMRFNQVYIYNQDLVKIDYKNELFYCNDFGTLAEAMLEFEYA